MDGYVVFQLAFVNKLIDKAKILQASIPIQVLHVK